MFFKYHEIGIPWHETGKWAETPCDFFPHIEIWHVCQQTCKVTRAGVKYRMISNCGQIRLITSDGQIRQITSELLAPEHKNVVFSSPVLFRRSYCTTPGVSVVFAATNVKVLR